MGIPFSHPGINGCVLLRRAFRSLPRPSWALEPNHPPAGVSALNMCTAVIRNPPGHEYGSISWEDTYALGFRVFGSQSAITEVIMK